MAAWLNVWLPVAMMLRILQVSGPPFMVNCAMGSRVQALGTVSLPVRVHHSRIQPTPEKAASSQPCLAEVAGDGQREECQEKGISTSDTPSASAAEMRDHPTIVSLRFVVVEGEVRPS